MTSPPPTRTFLLLSGHRSQRKHPGFTARQRQHQRERRRAEAPAAAPGHKGAGEVLVVVSEDDDARVRMPTAALPPPADHVSRVPGPAEEHDLHVRPRHLPAVRRPNERVPDLPQSHRAPNPPLLDGPLPRRRPPHLLPAHFLSLGERSAGGRRCPTIPMPSGQPATGVLRCPTQHHKCFARVPMDFLLPCEKKNKNV